VRVEVIEDIDAFAAAAGDLLASDEANHTVLLSALQGARQARVRGEPLPDGWFSAVVIDGNQVVAAGRCWRRKWLMTTGSTEALRTLGHWAAHRGNYSGIVGPEDSVRAFEAGGGLAARTHLELPLMRLDGQPVQSHAVAGTLRAASLDDLELLLDWNEAFRVEARIDLTTEQVAADVERKTRIGTQYLWLDPADRPVGMIGGQTIAPSGARIGPVYTPPSLRGRGVGGAMVASLTQRLQDAGARCVFLFTDAANPTSNALYQRIGFVPIGRHLHRVLVASG
jgi:RimJ/RimL family protein N-acetyltransferase